jgi:sulfite exporter TauE/SafE
LACAEIAMMLPVARNNPKRKPYNYSYHAGRIGSYAAIGLLFGWIGQGLYLAGVQQRLSIFAGVLMITITVVQKVLSPNTIFHAPYIRLFRL